MKNFEERLKKLETLAERIRDEDVPLEDAVGIFEEGIKLSRGLEKDMEKLEGRVEILLNQPQTAEDKPQLGLFADSED
ncbi:MAG: exodeoxyribonuclease VII small subunit [Spirochaetes bacterium GWD1_61_31]|nr:MAG: exodeoxyribonuclease VII small subunit [Spirochaetes bacterium GWB1_60_80]OHD34824.1 MAG: exodeoxyribonuclease VII small subunit [Spirochaetes bacterium GWD1_61_31]OHD46670.1 MAG: exodeoxyribonuclease VII small subunit [Spirochaetes bacterium GWE1_60_18]OHD61546.1 MAG: exodeoxyribonuclease VII small subunit [Spirochaetes bacterium GWF1_60_12]HAP44195.1 exodeoxyribonuclease VII small subunit [Spirochaetaceae bacterium]